MPTSNVKVGAVVDGEQLAACQDLRRRVFVVEQGIAAHLDADGLDDQAVHSLAIDGGIVVATGRLVVAAEHGVLARIAVAPSHRGRGLGGRIVQHLESQALERGAHSLSLHPHQHLERFYQRLGYQKVPGTSVVGEHRLITMVKTLHPDRRG